MSQTKDILKFNRDIIISELENKLIGLYNSFREGNEENIEAFGAFSQQLDKGQLPENTAYKKILFKNALDVPFAKEVLDDILDAGDILMALDAFPTIVPKAYLRALNHYERCLYRAITLSNKNLVMVIIDMALKLMMTLHEHQDYTHISDNSKQPEEEPAEGFKKKTCRKVSD